MIKKKFQFFCCAMLLFSIFQDSYNQRINIRKIRNIASFETCTFSLCVVCMCMYLHFKSAKEHAGDNTDRQILLIENEPLVSTVVRVDELRFPSVMIGTLKIDFDYFLRADGSLENFKDEVEYEYFMYVLKKISDKNFPLDLKYLIQLYVNGAFFREYYRYSPKNYAKKSRNSEDNFDHIDNEYSRKKLLYPVNFGLSQLMLADSSGKWYSFKNSIWLSSGNILCIKNEKEEIVKNMFFNFDPDQTNIENMILDGCNQQGYYVFSINHPTEQNKSQIFVANIGYESSDDTRIPSYKTIDAQISTIMIHPTKDVALCSSTKKDNQERISHELHLFSVPFDITIPTDFGCKKIASFCNNTYLAVTMEGKLCVLWLEKKTIHFDLKEHKSIFIDFAPDTTRQTDNGFTPCWAFLTNKGKIFCCDFLHPLIKERRLHFILQAEQPKTFHGINEDYFKLYYHNEKLGVLYTYQGCRANKLILYDYERA